MPMPAPVRPPGETRDLIIEILSKSPIPMTWPEITSAAGITAGYRTQKRMLESGQIQLYKSDSSGKKCFVASDYSVKPKYRTEANTRASERQNHSCFQDTEFTERLERLDDEHMRPLNQFREGLIDRLPPNSFVPNFDPNDAGVDASILLLLETPGRTPRATGFTSLDNPSATSKNLLQLVADAKLDRDHVLMWNTVPWDINDSDRIRPVSNMQLKMGTSELEKLLDILPALRFVVFLGKKAQKAIPVVTAKPQNLQFVACPHPSPTVLNTMPEKREEILAALVRARIGVFGE